MGHSTTDRIKPYEHNPFYWQYRGEPVLLLGGSVQDSLYQIDGLAEHLDTLVGCGGNFVRCSLSCRTPGSVFPFGKDGDLYDLDTWNPAYWQRLDTFLRLTSERGILVQVEFWDSWDYYRREGTWDTQPFNPRNNVNYTAGESGLPEEVDHWPFEKIQPFFETPPELRDLVVARKYQERLFDKHLEHLFAYDHILYCMNNETNADPRWGFYWNDRLKAAAADKGIEVETTDMFDNWDPSDGRVPGAMIQDTARHPFLHRSNALVSIDHPERYSFVDISNHNAQRGQVHYETAMFVRERIKNSGRIRPFGCDKMYGGPMNSEFSSTPHEGLERWWRNVFAGMAAVRFHRPPAGLGLSGQAQTHIRGMRMLCEDLGVFTCEPANGLLSNRGENSAYCLADRGRAYAVCLINGGGVTLDRGPLSGEGTLRWLDIGNSRWHEPESVRPGSDLVLTAPGEGFWAALVKGATG